jgi:hypothetical protein
MKTKAPIVNRPELLAVAEFAKILIFSSFGRDSTHKCLIQQRRLLVMMRSQPLAAFSAAAFQNQAPSFGTHPGAEAVRFGATAVIRLKGTLHLTYSPILN